MAQSKRQYENLIIMNKLLLSVSPSWLKPIMIMGWLYGMRKGEILGLRWDTNIHFKSKKIELIKTKNQACLPS